MCIRDRFKIGNYPRFWLQYRYGHFLWEQYWFKGCTKPKKRPLSRTIHRDIRYKDSSLLANWNKKAWMDCPLSYKKKQFRVTNYETKNGQWCFLQSSILSLIRNTQNHYYDMKSFISYSNDLLGKGDCQDNYSIPRVTSPLVATITPLPLLTSLLLQLK